jgi:hypothetical protein
MYRGFAARSSDAEVNETDIDSKVTLILQEIARVRHKHSNNDVVDSTMLQHVEQEFVAHDYLQALESEVDRLLLSQAMTKRHRNPTSKEAKESQQEKHCRACNSNPCKWSPYCDADALAKRRKALFREMKSADDRRKKQISAEIQAIGVKLKLSVVDKELHEAYAANNDETITVKSLHGFPVTLNRVDAISALEHEHNRHVSRHVANKVVDDILIWMLNGWYFGQYSQPPSSSLSNPPPPSFVNRGNLFEKANDVQMHSNAAALTSSALQEENRAKLASLQTTTKYALFCITFSYFRALHLVRQQKEAFSLGQSKKPHLSNERMKMIQEHKNCVERQQRIEHFTRKARIGEERKRQRAELEQFERKRVSQFENMNKLAMNKLAAIVQRVYRGYLGRKTVENLKLERQKAASALGFLNACATEIGRAWRGYCGRRDAERLRKEMAEFLFALREQEAGAEEDEFAILISVQPEV